MAPQSLLRLLVIFSQLSMTVSGVIIGVVIFCHLIGSCLKIGQHSIFVNIRKIENNTRILDTLFIDDFTDIMVNIFIIIIIIGNLRN